MFGRTSLTSLICVEITGLWSKPSTPGVNTKVIFFFFLLLPVKRDACGFPTYFLSFLPHYYPSSKIMWKSRELGAKLKEVNMPSLAWIESSETLSVFLSLVLVNNWALITQLRVLCTLHHSSNPQFYPSRTNCPTRLLEPGDGWTSPAWFIWADKCDFYHVGQCLDS